MGNPPKTVVSCSSKTNKKPLPSTASRLKREEYSLPDNLFSGWKLLVGHNDWQEHFDGLEGAHKYRLNNLPSGSFGPGVYELALHHNKSAHGHSTRKVASRSIGEDTTVVVYVGRAEKVRQRLQHYGRCGSHLESLSDWTMIGRKSQQYKTNSTKVPGTKPEGLDRNVHPFNTMEEYSSGYPHLFTAAFSRGYSIAFRWTETKSKDDAEAIETGLLKIFDYAWNKGSNGERRPDDAFRKLQEQLLCSDDSSKARSLYKMPKILVSKVRNLHKKRTLSTVLSNKLWKLSEKLSLPDGHSELHIDLLSLPWKSHVKEEKSMISFSLPWKLHVKEENSMPSSLQICIVKHRDSSIMEPSSINVCGIRDSTGTVCKVVPMQGRKRCEAHKGMRLRCKD